jgi:hypothetical protein
MEFEQINNKFDTEFTNRLLKNKNIFYEIYEACGNKFSKGGGSYLFDGQTYRYCDLMYEKQELLYNSVKKMKNILEIGTYMGHSLLIMLLSNPQLQITCIDISDEFTLPAINVLNKHFNNAINFIHNDSLSALKNICSFNKHFNNAIENKFDFFHIDGYHENDYITNEFNLIQELNNSSDNVLRIIFDDQACLQYLQNCINTNYNVINRIIPNCHWNNVYFEIQL